MDFEQLAKIENESERVNRTYDIFNEDTRLNRSKAARVEFLTTVHYIEKYLKAGDKILDIGAGAGFPSMPIAIVKEDVSVTALDSTAKKMTFLSSAAKTLNVKNLKTISARAEDEKELFGTFDYVTARAVSSLRILLELAMPFLKVGGKFIAYKTDESELETSQNAEKTLNAKHIETKSLTLANGEKRALLVFEKTAPTPKQYPRQYGVIKKKPL